MKQELVTFALAVACVGFGFWLRGLRGRRHDRFESAPINKLEDASDALERAMDTFPANVAGEHQTKGNIMNPNVKTAEGRIRKATTVMAGARELISSFRQLLADAVAKTIANGATEAELAPLTELSTDLEVETDSLALAVQENTSAADTSPE